MAKTKTKNAAPKKVEEIAKKDFKHGEIRNIPIEDISANDWNPNEMTADEFNMLSENLDDVDFLQPLLVVPTAIVEGRQRYRIIDGEQRFEAQRLRDVLELPCVIADPERVPESKQKFQTVRMNKIKGSLNTKKFNALVEDLVKSGEYKFDELAHEFGFVDEDEFDLLIASARDSLPDNPDMRKEFDAAKEDIKTVDDLSLLLNRLFTKYGDSLPYNFMILDFGGKEHIWVRMPSKEFGKAKAHAREAMENGITFDSIMSRVLTLMDVGKFVEKHRDFLEEAKKEETTIEDLTDGD